MDIHKTKRWQILRKKVLKRDKYLCKESLRYGKRVEAFVVHHIYPVNSFPEYAFCEWNLISLSHKEHEAMHKRDTRELTEKGVWWMERISPHIYNK